MEEVEKPLMSDDQVQVKVFTISANPADWHIIRGKPFFARQFLLGLTDRSASHNKSMCAIGEGSYILNISL